jgi:hypothetical protein
MISVRWRTAAGGGCDHATILRCRLMPQSPQSRQGVRRQVAGPDGQVYLIQAAPSGFVQWSRGSAQGPVGFAVHMVVTWLLHRLVFRGGWTVVVWQGDRVARMRTTVEKRRYPDRASALAAWEGLASTVARSGPPTT